MGGEPAAGRGRGDVGEIGEEVGRERCPRSRAPEKEEVVNGIKDPKKVKSLTCTLFDYLEVFSDRNLNIFKREQEPKRQNFISKGNKREWAHPK